MADEVIKISELNAASLPLDGTEIVPMVQGGVTVFASTQDIADRVDVSSYLIELQVDAASTTNIDPLSPPSTIDGQTTSSLNLVLLTGQTDPNDNGIYQYNNISGDLDNKTSLFIDQIFQLLIVTLNGTTYKGAIFICTSTGSGNIFLQIGGSAGGGGGSNVLKTSVKYSESITKGQAVYVSGGSGTNILVSKADNTTEATSSKTLGLAETTGAANTQSNAITDGILSGLDTSTATIGDPVWLGTAGNLIYGLANKPVAPAHLVYIGVVTRVSATVGEIFVKIQNGFELGEIHNVLLTSLVDKNILMYEASTQLWKNKTIADALGFTPENVSNKTNTVAGNESSTSLYASIKGIVDYLTSWFFVSQSNRYLSGTATGTNTYVLTLSPALTAYNFGLPLRIKFSNASTGLSTLNINGVGAKKLFENTTTQIGSGDLSANQIYTFIYDDTLDSGAGGWLLSGFTPATTGSQGIVQLDTDGNIQSNTNPSRAVTSGNLSAWWTWVKTQTQTFAAQIIFTSAIRLNSANGTNGILGANGNGVLAFTDNASAVNKVEVVNSTTSNAVEVKANGSDTNIALKVSSKGAAVISFFTNAIERFKIGAAGELFASSLIGSGSRVVIAAPSGDLSATLETFDPVINQQWVALSPFSTFTENTIWGSDKGSLTLSNLILNRLGALFTFKYTYTLVATSTASSTLVLKLKHGSTILYTESISLTAITGTTVNIATSGWIQTTSLGASGVLKGFVHLIFGSTSYFKYINIASNLTADSILTETVQIDTGTFTFTSNQGLTLNEA